MLSVSPASVVSYIRHVIDSTTALPAENFSRHRQASLPGLEILSLDCGGELGEAIDSNLIATHCWDDLPTERMKVFIVHPQIAGVQPPATFETEGIPPHVIDQMTAKHGLRFSYFQDLDHWHMYDAERRIAVQLMSGPNAHPPWERGAPLRPFLHWYYAQRGMRLGHAGTLGIGGKGVLLAGAGGSGKSGTVIAGLLSGLQSVGDDYVILDLSDGVVARPAFSTLKQDAEGWRRLGLANIIPGSLELNWQGKYEFRLSQVSPTAVPSEFRIGALLIPRVSPHDKTEITQVARAHAMQSVAMSSVHQMPGDYESGFRFFGMITRMLPCYRLELGRNPAAVAGVVSDFIQRLPA